MHFTFKVILAFFVFSFASGFDPRIIGGQESSIEDLPYQAQLETALLGLIWRFSCGAVIVGPNSVLTTATCVYNSKVENVRIKAGSSIRGEGNIHKAVNITVHPNNTDWFFNDIAFITVEPRFIFHSGVKAIPLATYEPAPGAPATVSGFGRLLPDEEKPSDLLQKAIVPIVDKKLCMQNYDGVGNVTESMICAGYEQGGIDSCAGDTGGPLQIDNVLIGLVSWGYGCAKPNYPAVYTSVPVFREWVQEQMELANDS